MATAELIESDSGGVSTQAMAMAVSRQAQEVQAAMIIARRFPRDEQRAVAKIVAACKRHALAEASQYEYPRGGQKITGPSIRLAEVLAQCWGNLDFGITELERRNGESVAMAYCWDLESNVRQTKVFTVRHVRDKRGGPEMLRDERDIYEIVANNGARRLRACILGIIPGDIQDLALEECDKTLEGKNTEPLVDRVRKMVALFADIGVTVAMLEDKLGHKLDAATPRDVLRFGKIYTAIRDGVAKVDDHFRHSTAATAHPASVDDLTAMLEQSSYEPEQAEEKP